MDCNPAQSALLELKRVAIRRLAHNDVWALFGEGKVGWGGLGSAASWEPGCGARAMRCTRTVPASPPYLTHRRRIYTPRSTRAPELYERQLLRTNNQGLA